MPLVISPRASTCKKIIHIAIAGKRLFFIIRPFKTEIKKTSILSMPSNVFGELADPHGIQEADGSIPFSSTNLLK